MPLLESGAQVLIPRVVPKSGQQKTAKAQPTVASSMLVSSHLLLLRLLLEESENGFVLCFSAWS